MTYSGFKFGIATPRKEKPSHLLVVFFFSSCCITGERLFLSPSFSLGFGGVLSICLKTASPFSLSVFLLEFDMKYLDLNSLDHDPELAKAMGSMVVAWAHAETVMVHVFSLLTGLHYNKAAPAYYTIPTFQSRKNVILSLIVSWDGNKDKKDTLTKAIGKLADLSRTRNHWIHGTWAVDKKTDKTAIFSMRLPDTINRQKPIKVHDVKNHIRRVHQRTADLQDLVPKKISLRS